MTFFSDTTGLQKRIAAVQDEVSRAAKAAGRNASEITLIGVTKTHPAATVRLAVQAGLKNIGENRVQEAEEKVNEIGRRSATWHLIGHLQTNKARKAVALFDVIHSIDSSALARRLDRICIEEERDSLPVLIQVNLGAEDTKAGLSEAALPEVANTVAACERLKLIGLMTIPPFFDDPDRVRPYFTRLRELREKLYADGQFEGEVAHLSMGMSHDFKVAVEEGATMIRVGTAIFGERGDL
jgi:pyridoxal phosphate enzyme (YggS family)